MAKRKLAKKSGHRKSKIFKRNNDEKPSVTPGLVSATRSTTVKYDDLGVRKILSDYTRENYGVFVSEDAWEMATDEDDNFITSVSASVVVKVDPRSPTGLEGDEDKHMEDSETDEESGDEPDDEGS